MGFLGLTGNAITYTDFQSIIEGIQAQISISSVVSILATGVGIAVGFAFMWWGVRKLIKVLMSAFKKGKVSL